MTRLGLLGACVAMAVLGSADRVAAQSEFLGDRCGPTLTLCRSTGAPCPDSTHAVTTMTSGGEAVCFCASGDARLGTPTLCCNASVGTGCPLGTTCANIDGTSADVCVGSGINLCSAGMTPLTREGVLACFTSIDMAMTSPYWAQGDCDADGRPNGMEELGPTDPCCNEDTDFDCCMAELDDAAACCARTASDPDACCISAGADPALCCASDPIGCCEGTSDPESCCREAGGEALDCCVFSSTPGSCCFVHGGEASLCCELAVDEPDLAQCRDAGVATDAGSNLLDGGDRDGGIALEDASAADAANAAVDGGATLDTGNLGFGGGGGCRCNAQGRSRPSPWTLVLAALAIAIPSFRKRR